MNIRSSFDSTTNAVNKLPDQVRDRYQRTSSRGLVICGIAGAVFLVVACWAIYSVVVPATKKEPPPPPVIVQKATSGNVSVVEHTIGTVISNATVQVTARVQGQLMKAYFTEGQVVHKGDLLFQIDPRPYQAAYNNAVASLTAAQAKAARYARLLAQKAVAPQDADDARAAYLEAAANVQTAQLNLGFTEIHSPIDGKTGAILIQPGNQIVSTGSNAGSSALVTITQIQPIKISFFLPQSDLPRIQKRMAGHGMQVTLTQQGSVDAPLIATVDFVGNIVNAQTGTIELRATFGNDTGTLVPGQIVDVGVVLDSLQHATVVPHEAINLGPATSFVYVVKNGVAQMVPVTVVHDDGTTAAITGHVKPGDTIITDGQLRVKPGQPVKISQPPKK